MSTLGPTEEQRQALCAWLTANNINPNTVPLHTDLSITETGGQRLIEYTEYVRDEKTGNVLADGQGYARMRGRRVPCIEEPPTWLNIPEGSS